MVPSAKRGIPPVNSAPANSQEALVETSPSQLTPASAPTREHAFPTPSVVVTLQPPRLNGELFRNTLFDTAEVPRRSNAGFWLRVAGIGLGAGLLVAAGYATAVGSFHERIPHLTQPSAAGVVARTSVLNSTLLATVAPSAPSIEAPASAALPPSAAMVAMPPSAASTAPTAIVPPAFKSSTHRGQTKPSAHRAAVETTNSHAVRVKPVVAAAPIGDLPEQPDREVVQSGIEALRPELAACAAGVHGSMFANVTIAGSGRVTYTTVEGAYAGSPQGSCMARALRTASFPQFSAPSLKVRYPFVF
jgi:hypothetical protein